MPGSAPEEDDPVETLLRWQASGGIWRVLARRSDAVVISLVQCTGDEEAARFTSGDPGLLVFVAGRDSSEE